MGLIIIIIIICKLGFNWLVIVRFLVINIRKTKEKLEIEMLNYFVPFCFLKSTICTGEIKQALDLLLLDFTFDACIS